MIRKVLIISMLLIVPFILTAGEMSLEECIETTIAESEELKSVDASIESADYEKSSNLMNFFPSAKVDFQYLYMKYFPEVIPINLPLGASFARNPEMVALLEQDMSPAEIDAYFDAMNFSFPAPPEWSREVSISITQPITPLWSISKGYDISSTVHEIEKLKKTSKREKLKTTVTSYYYNYIMLENLESLLGDIDDQLSRYENTAQNFINAGLSDKRAVLKIRIEQTKLARDIQAAKSSKKVLKTALALLMNKKRDDFTLKSTDVEFSAVSAESESVLALQEQYRNEIKMLSKSDEIAANMQDISLQPLIPTLALTGGFKKNMDATIFSPEGTFFIGGVASWDIGVDWFKNYYNYKKSKSDYIKTKLANIDAKKKMTLQVTKMYEDLKVSEKNIEIAEKEIEEAEENLRIEENKYKEKMTTETDLLKASISLKNAKTSYLTAKYRYIIALHELAGTIGVGVDKLK